MKDQNNQKHEFLVEISQNESDGVVDLLIYKNQYVLFQKYILGVILNLIMFADDI